MATSDRSCCASKGCCRGRATEQEGTQESLDPRPPEGETVAPAVAVADPISSSTVAPPPGTPQTRPDDGQQSPQGAIISPKSLSQFLPVVTPSQDPEKEAFGCIENCCGSPKNSAIVASSLPFDEKAAMEGQSQQLAAPEEHSHVGSEQVDTAAGETSAGPPPSKGPRRPPPTRDVVDTDSVQEEEPPRLDLKRVSLLVEPIACGTCCDTELRSAITSIPAVKRFTINSVMGRIEMDVDLGQISVQQIISEIHKKSKFTPVELPKVQGHGLELLVNDALDFCGLRRPNGVNRITPIQSGPNHPGRAIDDEENALDSASDASQEPRQRAPSRRPLLRRRSVRDSTMEESQGRVCVPYDPATIGARDIFKHYQRMAPEQNVKLAPPSLGPEIAGSGRQAWRRALKVFLAASALTLPVLVFAYGPSETSNTIQIYDHISLVLATLVQGVAFYEFSMAAIRSLFRSHIIGMDFLIAFSTSAAYVYSVVAYAFLLLGRPLPTGSFFETSTLLVTFILLGRVVTSFASYRASKSVLFHSLQAAEALLMVNDRDTETTDARLLQLGDRFKVPPYSRIVTDGKVINGGSEVDESHVTGENSPVAKGRDSVVYAGSMNLSGALDIELTALPPDNTISQIARLVENAVLSKPKAQALADAIAGQFVPVVIVIGTIVFLSRVFTGKYARQESWGHSLILALQYAIATLIVCCPCAIGLAVPVVILVATGVAARHGIIFRNPQKMEVAHRVTDIVFDKTGTLTTGELIVARDPLLFADREPDVADIPYYHERALRGLLQDIKHPVAIAVARHTNETLGPQHPAFHVDNIKEVPGCGVEGVVTDTSGRKLRYRVGSPGWTRMEPMLGDRRSTTLCFVRVRETRNQNITIFYLQDKVGPGTKDAIALLQKKGIKVHLVSGDLADPVLEVAGIAGISDDCVRAELDPEHKQSYIHDLQRQGRTVMFCGDEVNDSVALRQADVGVHMSHGSDIAKAASDVVLQYPRVGAVPVMLDISRAAYRRIVFNFCWSFVYNLAAILLTSGALAMIRVTPAYAGLGELISVLPVVIVGLSLTWINFNKRSRATESA